MRVGLLGGTFNPIHNGHIHMALAALKELNLDEIWLIPAGIPPHKDNIPGACRLDRINMCEIAARSYPDIKVKKIESYSLERNYTYKTLLYLTKEYPENELYFIIGEDSFYDFPKWAKPDVIISLATIVVCVRDELNASFSLKFENYIRKFNLDAKCFVLLQEEKLIASSTEIREAVTSGNIPKELDSAVYSYIMEHHLYMSHYTLEDIEKAKAKLKEKLKKNRYTHTIGVMHTAASLAMAHSYPVEDAMMAGLLHDCAKYMSEEELLMECKKNKIAVTDAEKESPHLLHAKLGAFYACNKYNVNEDEILHAIEVHTTGCVNMNLLDKIIFVADYIEPNRNKAAHLNELRSLAFTDIDLTCCMILYDTINFLREKNDPIDETTYDTYEYFFNIILNRGNDVSIMEVSNE